MCSFKWLTVSIPFTVLLVMSNAQTPCTTDGWFGTNCEYQCHCSDSAPCDAVDGSCSSGCHSDWFGFACQYDRMTFTAGDDLDWLTDNNDATCNPESTQFVNVTLDTAIPLTWIRVRLNHTEYLEELELNYQSQFTPNSPLLNCTDLQTAKVNDVTVDIYCPTNTTVSQVTLSGSGVMSLCSLYISGGRNMALNQTTQQSSRYSPQGAPQAFLAENAVDGLVDDGTNERSTCSHTDLADSPHWWTVNFTQAVHVTRLVINVREDQCCMERLAVTLTAHPEDSNNTDTPYVYTDPQWQGHAFYIAAPSPTIGFPVSQIRVDAGPDSRALALCEVFVFGEVVCPAGTFGLACERQCHCASEGGNCLVHSGGCPGGCATDFAGEDCSDCVAGKHGESCRLPCHANCGGDNSCNRTNGACSQGCDPGYTGDRCQFDCPEGSYGAGCLQNCSTSCAGPENACHHIDGKCTFGCEDGYLGDMCDTHCRANKYGPGCTQTCSVNCYGYSSIRCNIFTGECYRGCKQGYQGKKCTHECDSGWYGPGCSRRCSVFCAVTGNICDPEYGGCIRCIPGTYGTTCGYNCNINCGGPENICTSDGGYCVDGCDPGRWGSRCEKACTDRCAGPDNACEKYGGICINCDTGYYGDQCENLCSSNCGGPDKACYRVNGRCEECPLGYYGDWCTKSCSSRNCAGTGCERDTGACLACPPGYYGIHCLSECNGSCGGPNNLCNILSGDCEQGCDPGYKGAKCDEECPAGTNGEACADSYLDCNKTDGSCDQRCKPGYHGSFCSDICPRGKYGHGCVHNCSAQCAGQDRPCHHVDGVCYLGCVQDDQSPVCRGHSALQRSQESDGSDINIWGIAASVVAVGAFVAIGILVWRLYKASRRQPPLLPPLANNGHTEAVRQRDEDNQSPPLPGNRPTPTVPPFPPEETSPEYIQFDQHYDRPGGIPTRSGDFEYEIAFPVASSPSDQD